MVQRNQEIKKESWIGVDCMIYKMNNQKLQRGGDFTFKVLPSCKTDETSDDIRITDRVS